MNASNYYVRARRLAQLLDVSVSTLWRWVDSGQIPKPRKLGPAVTAWSADDMSEMGIDLGALSPRGGVQPRERDATPKVGTPPSKNTSPGYKVSRLIPGALPIGRALSPREIVAAAIPATIVSGVYFLIRDGAIVYVGQSANVPARIGDHTKSKEFDRFAYIPCSPDKLDLIESIYVRILEPPLNGRMANGKTVSAPGAFSRLLGET